MSIENLLKLVYSRDFENWKDKHEEAFESLFGAQGGRYPLPSKSAVQLRAPDVNFESTVPFAAYIRAGSADKGRYGGFSFVIFPSLDEPALVGLVVRTDGLAPDEQVLSRPGHARKAQAICAWLNKKFGQGKLVAWAKQDPTRVDVDIPDTVRKSWPAFKRTFDRYGQWIYAIFKPSENENATREALTAFLDFTFAERGIEPLTAHQLSRDRITTEWFEYLMPQITRTEVRKLLEQKRYVVIQGPPGTGKTTMAQELLTEEYQGKGNVIQLHPNSTYETFIGGLAPLRSEQGIGFEFAPKPGFLMEAAEEALSIAPKPYLLVVDEINRADLSKMLGEAIFLLESNPIQKREIQLAYDFGKPFHKRFALPENLLVLGTMNSADRSIAMVDVAIRRRFSFVSLWPQMSVVKEHGCELMRSRFKDLIDIFVDYAQDDSFHFVPGHSYFLEKEPEKAKHSLKTGLLPLLEEYLAQNYVTGFGEQIRAYLQEIRSL